MTGVVYREGSKFNSRKITTQNRISSNSSCSSFHTIALPRKKSWSASRKVHPKMNTSPRMNATPFTANHPSSRRHALRHQHSVQRGLSTISQVCFEVARARIQVGRLISLGHLYREGGKTAQRPLKQQRGEGDHRVSERFFFARSRIDRSLQRLKSWEIDLRTDGWTSGHYTVGRAMALETGNSEFLLVCYTNSSG